MDYLKNIAEKVLTGNTLFFASYLTGCAIYFIGIWTHSTEIMCLAVPYFSILTFVETEKIRQEIKGLGKKNENE